LAVSITTFCITALILTTQRRDDQLAEHRDQMTLEFAILSEQKPAKIIQLLEDSRRDIPLVDNRVPSHTARASGESWLERCEACRRKDDLASSRVEKDEHSLCGAWDLPCPGRRGAKLAGPIDPGRRYPVPALAVWAGTTGFLIRGDGCGRSVTGTSPPPMRSGGDPSNLCVIGTARVERWIMPALMPCIRTGTKQMRIAVSS
jgi:hypothetical protein